MSIGQGLDGREEVEAVTGEVLRTAGAGKLLGVWTMVVTSEGRRRLHKKLFYSTAELTDDARKVN